MTDELKKANRYYWTGGFWAGAAVFSSAWVMVLLFVVWVMYD